MPGLGEIFIKKVCYSSYPPKQWVHIDGTTCQNGGGLRGFYNNKDGLRHGFTNKCRCHLSVQWPIWAASCCWYVFDAYNTTPHNMLVLLNELTTKAYTDTYICLYIHIYTYIFNISVYTDIETFFVGGHSSSFLPFSFFSHFLFISSYSVSFLHFCCDFPFLNHQKVSFSTLSAKWCWVSVFEPKNQLRWHIPNPRQGEPINAVVMFLSSSFLFISLGFPVPRSLKMPHSQHFSEKTLSTPFQPRKHRTLRWHIPTSRPTKSIHRYTYSFSILV